MKSILSARNILPSLVLCCLASAIASAAEESKLAASDPQADALLARHLEKHARLVIGMPGWL
jgi:hypothetical protein